MRYVVITNVEKGMVLGQTLFGNNFEQLYTQGTKLKTAHINTINRLGFSGIYIQDDTSQPVHVEPIVPEDIRINIAKAAKKFLKQAKTDSESNTMTNVSVDEQKSIVLPVIERLVAVKEPVIEHFDIKAFADYDYYHAANVMMLSLVLGIKLGIAGDKLFELGIASLVHDVGNAFIPSDILNKPGELTPEEFAIVKSHAEKGFEYLRNYYDLSPAACNGALQHHENYDGTGYPGNLRKNKISLFGRIIALTDVFDALISRRPYRHALHPYQALDIIRQKSDRKFDPEIVYTIEKVIAPYPVATCVELNSYEKCIVAENYADDLSRPKLYVPGKRGYYIDLKNDPSFKNSTIIGIINE
jgi:HD-GYP domain-containing protein (c-di-GMP phosphodiesterase class II)